MSQSQFHAKRDGYIQDRPLPEYIDMSYEVMGYEVG